MNAKAIGIVTARGLAIFFLINGLYYLVTGTVLLLKHEMGYSATYFIPVFANASILVLAAGLLWRNAANFAAPAEQVTGDPLTTQSALRAAVIGICVFTAFSHLSATVNFLWQWIEMNTDPKYPGGAKYYTVGDLFAFAAALITIIVMCQGRAIVKFFSYQHSDEDDPSEPEGPPA